MNSHKNESFVLSNNSYSAGFPGAVGVTQSRSTINNNNNLGLKQKKAANNDLSTLSPTARGDNTTLLDDSLFKPSLKEISKDQH